MRGILEILCYMKFWLVDLILWEQTSLLVCFVVVVVVVVFPHFCLLLLIVRLSIKGQCKVNVCDACKKCLWNMLNGIMFIISFTMWVIWKQFCVIKNIMSLLGVDVPREGRRGEGGWYLKPLNEVISRHINACSGKTLSYMNAWSHWRTLKDACLLTHVLVTVNKELLGWCSGHTLLFSN